MTFRHSFLSTAAKKAGQLFGPSLIAMLIALTVIVAGVVMDLHLTAKYQQEQRQEVERYGSSMVRRVAAKVDTLFVSAESLGHVLTGKANFDPVGLRPFALKTLSELPYLSLVVMAPDFKASHSFGRTDIATDHRIAPLKGLDPQRLEADLQAAKGRIRPLLLPASQEKYLTVILPLNRESSDPASAWGAIALLVDKHTFFSMTRNVQQVGITGQMPGTNIDWLRLGMFDAAHPEHLAFHGDDSVRDQQPLQWSINVRDASWLAMAAPKVGWDMAPPDQFRTRLLMLLGGLAIIIPVLVATTLITERNRNIAELRMREARLLELSQRFNLAMEASNMGIWQVTRDGEHLYWDERAAGLHGCEPDGISSRLDEWLSSVMPSDRAAAEAHFFNCLCTDHPCTETYRIQLKDGDIRYLRSAGARFSSDDDPYRTTGIVWDVTADVLMTQALRDAKDDSDIKNAELELALDELSNRERQLEQMSSRLELALASSGCGVWEFNPATGQERWDARMCALYGIAPTSDPIPQSLWLSLILPEDQQKARDACKTYLTGDVEEPLVVRVALADGTIRYIRSIGQLQIDQYGQSKLIGLAFDITQDAEMTAELKMAKAESDAKNVELEQAKSRIEHNSLHDPLTLLGNRRKLDAELERLSRASQREKQDFAILHLDLDRFKQINDTLGHAAGDAMLAHVSKILMRNVRPNDIVARIGGDEFVILTLDGRSVEDLTELSQRIIAEFRQPFDFEGFSCRCGVSIGIAQAGRTMIDPRQILVNADLALYRAKALGRNGCEFFTQNLQAEIISHKRTADEVLAAIDNDEFVTWYQPQFCARTGQLSGAEALIRWNHPLHGILTPDRFLRIAEDLNVSAVLDQFVLETVLKDKMRWKAMGLDVPKVSVNVSSNRLHDHGLIDTLSTLAISPGEISFELVESIFLDDSDDSAAGNLERIKALGIEIEIDDFGTGHTSIVSLLKLRPQRLKIDRQIVMPILHAPQERSMVRSIIDIARSLGVDTVAEGVETMQHAAMLRDLGCDLLQGYAFARPLSFEDFTQEARAGWLRDAA